MFPRPLGRLLFMTAGIPLSSAGTTTEDGLRRLVELGLDGTELEFVRNVFLNDGTAPPIRISAHEKGLVLTAHGSYFINLASQEREKAKASAERVLKAARIAHLAGARSVTFHAAFYQKRDPVKVHEKVRKALDGITSMLRDEGVGIWIKPELTGKPSQYGSLEELLRLSQEVEGVGPCIDWAHLHARTVGGYNAYDEIVGVLGSVRDALGKVAVEDLHMHIAGIHFGPKGERTHLDLDDGGSDLAYSEILRALKKERVRGCLVCESPSIEGDALRLRKAYERL